MMSLFQFQSIKITIFRNYLRNKAAGDDLLIEMKIYGLWNEK